MEKRGIRRANVLGIERDAAGRVEKWTHEWMDLNVESRPKKCSLIPGVSAGLSIWRAETSQMDDGRKEDRTSKRSMTFRDCHIHASHDSPSSPASRGVLPDSSNARRHPAHKQSPVLPRPMSLIVNEASTTTHTASPSSSRQPAGQPTWGLV